MEEEVIEVVGPRGRHDPERSAVRHGHESGEVTPGRQRVGIERPRVRATDGSGELALATYRHFADGDPLSPIVLELASGLATASLEGSGKGAGSAAAQSPAREARHRPRFQNASCGSR